MTNRDTGEARCRVYWNTHGCCLERGHDGPHLCDCTFDEHGELIPHIDEAPELGNVGRPPYYGPATKFFGEDTTLLNETRKQGGK